MENEIALCLSGHMRTYQSCANNLYEKLLNKNNCDIFIHTWEDKKTNWNDVVKLYNPKNICIEQQKQFIDKFPRDYNTPHGIINNTFRISMFYKIYKCNELKIEYENFLNKQYKYVIRTRPDIVLSRSLNVNDLDPNILYIPTIGHDVWLDDKFAISSSKNIDLYSSIFLRMDDIYNQEGLLHPESILKQHCEKFNLPILQLSTKAGLLRSNNEVNDHSFHGTLDMFQKK